MPEYAETLLQTQFVNTVLDNARISAIRKSAVSKQLLPTIDNSVSIRANAIHRGKETMITLVNRTGTIRYLRVQYGMSGHWALHTSPFADKHSHLSFQLNEGRYLEFVDPRRFGRWKELETPEWSNSGPDLMHPALLGHVVHCQKESKFGRKLICESMLDQRVWFGCGNYLRAEALFLAEMNPFRKLEDLSIDEISNLILKLKYVINVAVLHGGTKLQSYRNPNGETVAGKTWLQCYKKGEWCIDSTGRRFWYDPKWRAACPFGREKAPKRAKTLLGTDK